MGPSSTQLLSTVKGPIDITHGFRTSTDIYAFVVYLQENERCGANAEVRPPPPRHAQV
jgi:hypothetical protein